MSDLKHGFFKRGFMLCDRCVLNGKCECLVPGGECSVEKKAYDWVASELMSQYDLKGLADEILVGRVAMYLIRIARVEVYEANVGISDASAVLGGYIVGLDNALRVLLKELALTRAERKKLEKDDVFADVDRLLNGLSRRRMGDSRMARKRSLMGSLLKDWRTDRLRFRLTTRGERFVDGKENSEKRG